MKPLKRFIAVVILPFFLISCATTDIPPIGAEGKPFQIARDERELWENSEKEQRKLEKSGRVYQDRLLEDYINHVGQKLIPPEVKREGALQLSFYIIKDPTLNAFAYPNGVIYIHSGLIARMENEAQLASVLSHEMTHVTHRHALKFVRDARNKAIAFTVAGIVASIAAAAIGAQQTKRGHPVTGAVIQQGADVLLGLGLQLGLLASVNGYGRQLEEEADIEGMERMLEAGYDPREVPKVFSLLLETYGDPSDIENFIFGSHPTNRARLQTSTKLLETNLAEKIKGRELVVNTQEFQLRTRVLVRENAVMDINIGRYNTAKAALEKVLSIVPNDAKAHYYLGEVYRRTAQGPEELKMAYKEYQEAIRHDPKYPEPHRELGLLYYKEGEKTLARAELERYLELKPDARDTEFIWEYLTELEAIQP